MLVLPYNGYFFLLHLGQQIHGVFLGLQQATREIWGICFAIRLAKQAPYAAALGRVWRSEAGSIYTSLCSGSPHRVPFEGGEPGINQFIYLWLLGSVLLIPVF